MIIFSLLLAPLPAAADTETNGGSRTTPAVPASSRSPYAPTALENLSTAYRLLSAYVRTYPDRISGPVYRDGDWCVSIDGTWFAWANGRMLPEDIKHRWEEFNNVSFYRYPRGAVAVRIISDDMAEYLGSLFEASKQDPQERHDGFLSALYRARDRRETESRLVRIEFLGFTFKVHEITVEPLKRVEHRIHSAADTDPETQEFLSSLKTMEGYYWRDVAGTSSRSYHGFGLAVDFIPRSFKRKPVYWRWAAAAGYDDWWAIPYSDRWTVPLPIVEAFEAEGFVWGGKWLFFDAMHFEYRPEILDLEFRTPFIR